MTEYKIRQGNIEDAEALADVETACFPPAEAATAEESLRAFPSILPISSFFMRTEF